MRLLTSSLFTLMLTIQSMPMLSANEFEDFKAARQNDFKQHRKSLISEFEQYKKELQEAFKNYRAKVEPIWGKRNSVPDQHRWVEYGENLHERSIIDFEKGVVRNELILDNNNEGINESQRQRLQALIAHSLTASPDQRSVVDIARSPARPHNFSASKKALISGMVKDQQGVGINNTNVNNFAKKQVLSNTGTEIRTGADGISRTIIYNEVAMVPDHIDKRAIAYKNRVVKESSRQNLTAALVFAVIETESSFNPNARSPIPAFGLMQLVPTSGARDAHRYLFKKDAIVTDSYLYKPGNNIELGAAYLHVIYYRYLKGIKNPQSRLWATAAAYNTGTGNIWKTFGIKGDRKNTALAKINSMTPEQVYDYLHKNLPHEETQKYVKKIRNRMSKYAVL